MTEEPRGHGGSGSTDEGPTMDLGLSRHGGPAPAGADADETVDLSAGGSKLGGVGLSAAALARMSAALRESVGSHIGPYKLLQLIGEGGFGSVFLAEQSEPVKRRVALKIIKLGMDTREVVGRFEQERQALAMMEHPNIAKVLDAGATQTGRPYFVMELVKGEPIVEYCDKQNLSIRDRLGLFAQVCNAVQHAHTKGIIHRDIKPSNILVSVVDGQPSTKVIDFGISKATASQLTERTVFTEHRQLIGTPEYMSPEQAEGSLDIDTRTDVYSLGVLLYELLTGSTPFGGDSLRSAAYAEIQRIIREVDPPKPSTRLSQSVEKIASVAASRKTEPGKLGTIIRGELDWIVMKALEKDRGRRYETANGLAADVQRYLNGEAVHAAPPGAGYRLRKLARRHRGAVVMGSVVAASLVLGLAGTAWQARKAARDRDVALVAGRAEAEQRREADSQRDRAAAAETEAKARAEELAEVAAFQSSMLSQIDVRRAGEELVADMRSRYSTSLEKDVPESERMGRVAGFGAELARVNATDAAKELINSTIIKPAVRAVDERFNGQPLVAARLRNTLSEQYRELGMYEEARVQQEQALAIRRRELGPKHPDTAESMNNMGVVLDNMGRSAEAEPLFLVALATRREVLGEDHKSTLVSIGNTGNFYRSRGNFEKAEPLLVASLDGARRTLGNQDRKTLISMNTLGFLYVDRGQMDRAEPLWREAFETGAKSLGPDDPDVLVWQNNLGGLLQAQNKMDEAEKLMRASLEGHRRVYGEAHPNTVRMMSTLGGHYQKRGMFAQAEELSRGALETMRRRLGNDHPYTIAGMDELSNVLRAKGDLAAAEPLARECVDAARRVLGPEHSETLDAMASLAKLHAAQGKLAEAEDEYNQVLDISARALGPEHPATLVVRTNLGGVLVEREKYAQAREFIATTLEIRRRVSGDDHPETLIAETYVARVKELSGDLEGAEAAFRSVLAKFRRVHGPTHPNTLSAIGNVAGVVRARGNSPEAETLWRESLAGTLQRFGKDHLRAAIVREGLGKALKDLGRHAEAETELLEASRILGIAQGVSAARRQRNAETLASLYESWEKSDPGKGYEAKAAQWKEKAGK